MQKGCPKCGRMVDDSNEFCPYCNFDFKELDNFFNRVSEKKNKEEEKYAGFIKRLVAGTTDAILMGLISSLIIYLISTFLIKGKIILLLSTPTYMLVYIFGNAIMERSSWHGSVGKHVVGIEVVDEYENPITFEAALLRNIAKFLNVLTLGIGFITCLGSPTKQTLSDKMTNTYVINKISTESLTNTEYANAGKRLVAFIIDIIFIFCVIFSIDKLCNYLNGMEFFDERAKPFLPIANTVSSFLFTLFYFPYNESIRGRTIGKKYMNIKLTGLDENTISLTRAFIRQVLIVLDIITLGFLLSLVSRKGQTLKDALTKTIVIDD